VSQILSKLGVATREEAAALALESRRRWWAAWPLAAKAAGAALVVAAVAGLGVLAWGALRGEDERFVEQIPSTAPQVCQPGEPGAVKSTDPRLLAVGWRADGVCWADVEGEAEYTVAGWIDYWPACEAWNAGERARRIEIDDSLPRDSTEYRFPSTPDPRFPNAKEWEIHIRALEPDGSSVARGARSLTKELDFSSC
jgi:hypothetical protein